MIAAVILAAGRSIRMGRSKLELPWKNGQSIISHVVEVFLEGGASPVLVVTGETRVAIEASLIGMEVDYAYNPDYATGGMLSSLKVGLRALETRRIEGALVSPADLPMLLPTTVQRLIQVWEDESPSIVAPSYEERRGHPVLISRKEWKAIQKLRDDQTLRDFLRQREGEISYLVVDDPGVLYDLDTPEDYRSAMDLNA
ncbi:MAG TPA: nucleotidyltransferase family protein [Anaerolineae bacterium]|nr:nucleotidyltransferase family protein [Anaerolineae bacterium]